MSGCEDQLDAAIRAVQTVAAAQLHDRRPAHEDFYAWGYALGELTYRLAGACRTLEQQQAVYGVRRILSDDEGGDPYQRLARMRRLLRELSDQLDSTSAIAQRYHAEAAHLGVEVDPDAPAGPVTG